MTRLLKGRISGSPENRSGYSTGTPNEPNAALNEDFVEMFASGQWNDIIDGDRSTRGTWWSILSTQPRWWTLR